MNYTESYWNGFRRIDFMFEDRNAILVFPDENNATTHWLLKTEYFDEFPELELELIKQGYHLAYVQNINRWGLKEDLDLKKRFRDFLVTEFNLYKKCIPVGMSCGAIFSIKLAGMYPEMVSVLYIDAPVINILSLLGMGNKTTDQEAEEIYQALSSNSSQMISYREHPLDYLPNILANNIPTCLVYANQDYSVDYTENADLVKAAYAKTKIPFCWFEKDGFGHHPHGLQGLNMQEQQTVIQFLLDNDR